MPFHIPQSGNIGEWLQFFSSLSTPVIVIAAMFHLLYFWFLRSWCKRDLHVIAGTLDDYTRGLQHRSVLERGVPLTTQIDAFVQDVNDVLSDASRSEDRS
ncbi:MAG: hypothetical protein H7Z17_19495, partial [Fuerstia sp.]|nr:hypothetical protein [Fuerstiella sp.]